MKFLSNEGDDLDIASAIVTKALEDRNRELETIVTAAVRGIAQAVGSVPIVKLQ